MKKNFLQLFKITTLGLLLGLGISLVQAEFVQAPGWTEPETTIDTSYPNNTRPPLNVGTDSQTKPGGSLGDLYYRPIIDSDYTRHGGLSVDALLVSAGAGFLKSVTIGTVDSSDNILIVNGNKKIANDLKIRSITSNKKVCTNSVGKLISCP